MKSSIAAAAAFAAGATASLYGESNLNHTCQLVPDYLSCSAEANPSTVDSCCVETFGGLVLATQYWDTWADKPLPANTWTLHGLWPDFCNGSYTQYCDLSRQYDPVPSPNTTNGLKNGTVVPPYTGPNIGTFLEPFGKYDLLAYMNKYWISQTGPNSGFWGHEFSKHATCYSTFDLPCYGPEYVEHQDVVDFFETTVAYYQKYPTWEWLADANIFPSNTTGYSLADIQNALTAKHGAVPYLGCSGPRYNDTAAGKAAGSTNTGRTQLSEVWYYMHVYGRPQDERYVAVDQTGSSSCTNVTGAVYYYQQGPQNGTAGGNSTAPVGTGSATRGASVASSGTVSRSSSFSPASSPKTPSTSVVVGGSITRGGSVAPSGTVVTRSGSGVVAPSSTRTVGTTSPLPTTLSSRSSSTSSTKAATTSSSSKTSSSSTTPAGYHFPTWTFPGISRPTWGWW